MHPTLNVMSPKYPEVKYKYKLYFLLINELVFALKYKEELSISKHVDMIVICSGGGGGLHIYMYVN